MKKIMTAFLVLALAGCAGSSKKETESQSKEPEKTKETAAQQTSTPETQQAREEYLQPEILEIGGGFTSSDQKYIKYGGLIRNPNETVAMDFINYTVTLKDASGKTVAVDDGTTSTVMAGDVIAVEGQINVEGSSPDSIYLKATCADNNFTENTEIIPSSEFYFRDVSVFERNGLSIVGTLLNNSNIHTESVKLTAFMKREGKIVYAQSTSIKDVAPGDNEFQLDIYVSGSPNYDTIELYANDYKHSDHKTIDSWTPESNPVNENVISYGTASAAQPEATPEPTPETQKDSGSFAEFKKKMDDYEAFFDSYIEFMKNYDSSDTSAMFTYLNMLAKYADAMEALDAIDESALTPEEEAYYMEVTLRISQKLLQVID